MGDLKVTKLSKSYRSRGGPVHVLSDLSMEFQSGRVHAIVGPSGCGKSTLLMLCGGLIRPDSGTITIGDDNLLALGSAERAARQAELVGFVFQQFHLIPYLNIEQNIQASCLARPVPDATQRCHDLVQRLGLEHRRGHIPAKLSSGEQQRVALGRALMNNPKLLIADEPTGNLDGDNTEHILGLLREFADGGGLVLMATHDRHVGDFADELHEFKDGRFSTRTGRS